MLRRVILPLIFGIGGFAVLMGLGLWQLQRLAWKEGVLAEIDARIGSAPVALPAAPDAAADRYLPVVVRGVFDGTELRVLASSRDTGAAYRMIAAFDTDDGRRVLIDRGLLPVETPPVPIAGQAATVVGNLHWPDEIDSYTPPPDLSANLWFARDVPAMAEALGTEPVLVIARTIDGPDLAAQPLPVDTRDIPNNHLGYAVQWFGMALVWAGMTVFLLWRIRRRTN
ncbi:SURF1 family protein [Palleronia sp. KMU-117]|uniref:SURF1 family protein n=1 Tax=Palleronia sp. KMU-117 TaxID=3434108 RepID=UPI003D70B94C